MADSSRTLIILKPDTVQRGLIGEVISRIERRGLKFVAMKMIWMTQDLAREHYAALTDKPFYPSLEEFITSSPVVVAVVEGPNAPSTVRATMGETDPLNSPPGSIRYEFGVSIGRNLIHGSDGSDSAEREISLYFTPEEIHSWSRDSDRWILED